MKERGVTTLHVVGKTFLGGVIDPLLITMDTVISAVFAEGTHNINKPFILTQSLITELMNMLTGFTVYNHNFQNYEEVLRKVC